MRKLKPEPKLIVMKGKWKAVPYTPKGCRKPRYLMAIGLSNGTEVCLQPVGDVYGGPLVLKEAAEWWADVLNKGRG
jgi:hypothetical protein